MHRAVRRVSRSLTGNPHRDLSNLSSFSVESSEGIIGIRVYPGGQIETGARNIGARFDWISC